MMVTVFEQGRVPLRASPVSEFAYFSERQAHGLLGMGKTMGARLASWDDPSTLRMHQFVGTVRTVDLELEILPKIETAPSMGSVRRNLLAMLGVAEDLEIKDSEVMAFWSSDEPILTALARLYCARLAEAVRRGLRQEYVVTEELLPQIRGKVHWAGQARVQATQRLEFDCVYDERSDDTPINRTLKAALRRAGQMLEGHRDAAMVARLRHAMDRVSDVPPSIDQIIRLRTDRLNRRFDPLLTLARLLLGNRNPDLGRTNQAQQRSYAIVWDMNSLFERYIGRTTARLCAGVGTEIRLQDTGQYLAREAVSERGAFLLRPDIVIGPMGRVAAIADTKWKQLDAKSDTLGVSESDAYQVVAYAHRFRTDLAVLIYPHLPSLGRAGVQRDFVVRAEGLGAVTIRVMTVDLADLAGVATHLRDGFLRASDQPVPRLTVSLAVG